MATYLSYTEYQQHGGDLPETDFTLAEFKARKRIDYLTDCRVQFMAKVPEEVKLCIMELIKVDSKIGSDALADNPLIASFNNDGYSESYGNTDTQIANLRQSADTTIREMLYGVRDDFGVPLLYRGVYGY